MLFAAGLGTRMRPLTDRLPKPLLPVAGRPLIDHALALADDAGIDRRVANSHHLADLLAAHLMPLGVAISHEPHLLDTGGGLKAALPLLGGAKAALTLNTDAVWTGPNPLTALLEAWEPARMDALLCLVPAVRAHAHSGGDFDRARGGRLRRGATHVYAGAQILGTAPVAASPGAVFSLNRVWDAAAVRGRLFGLVHPGGWCDVGSPPGIAEAEAMLETGPHGP